MNFDEWMLTIAPRHKPTDDGVTLRILRECWRTAQVTERERCAGICDTVARQYKDDNHGHAAERAANAIRLDQP